ncbi:MAG: OmpH family outer membrane protein [Calditrichae bacterium]|nr:OmpH family outer membrane protein [Calditrichota bacterium]MCB9057344.1 OmpH family outer membrane protein [Calditrichia bacterium]
MKSVKLLFILVLTTMVLTPAFAQKLAYVHSQRVLNEFEEYKGVQNKLTEIQNKYQAEYDQLVKEYQTLLDEIESQSLLLSPEKKQEKERMMQQKAMEIEKYKYEKLGPQGEIYKKQAELGQPVLDKINAVIKKIGEDEGYDFIFDGAVGILWAKPAHDITQQVLDELNKGAGKK